MQSESIKLPLLGLDFVDLGIVLQNNKINKRVFFFKVVSYNNVEKLREIYLFAVSEDQVYKWESCLEPSDDINHHDRTLKIVKSRLLK